ncbi:Sugar kinase of the NBD/HSP70 family, may contain an N-terminal HTH domain [Paenibacillus sp. yr247]|uniref:ROK family transcriptional regulator n=1 Tax=Paenibacillus sp. yr247 TaxID=1761880 RepID=UPI0008825373|nr:ROK family transcriptional regulator [Paenibacillus sp. yr247]SDN96533.1 Sugar kinase of the NBD/HSP70 family, may contain an N-terminal HTH domain [Paenibacillus sp. yr247]
MIGRGQTGNTKLVKQINREGILHQLKERTRMSRADLAKLTELSRPCVSSLVDEMIQEGIIREVGVGESKGGRKPILLEYNFQAYGVVGAVFEGSTLQLAIADLKGEVLFQYKTLLSHQKDGQGTIESVERGLAALLTQSGFNKSRLLGIGLGLPGITQRREGTVSYSPSTGWMGLPVQKEIEDRLGLPVIIDNDVNLMTLGEFHKGVGKNFPNLVYMYVGTGIGAGIVIDGQLYRGVREASGEIGYMIIGPIRNRAQGEYGAFENNYSVTAIREKAKLLLKSMDEGTSVIKQLVTQASQGDVDAQSLLDDIYKHWAYGIANIASVMDPGLFVLSGEMIHIGADGVLTIHQMLTDLVPLVPQLKMASLGDQAGIIGAIHSVLEALPSTLNPEVKLKRRS